MRNSGGNSFRPSVCRIVIGKDRTFCRFPRKNPYGARRNGLSSTAGPRVRISFPPAASQERTPPRSTKSRNGFGLSDWQTASARNDRERSNRTRQNAEDLFKPKPQTTRADVPNDDSSAEYQPRRQPRIFAIPPVVPMSTTKVEPAAEPKQIRRKAIDKRGTREIPLSQFGRVRTLTSYGMTPAQVAELYGVAVGEIDRIIRRPR